MNIKDIEELKKWNDEYQMRYSKLEAIKNMKVKEVLDILRRYGFDNINDYKKLIELRDSKKPIIEEYITNARKILEESESKLKEIEESI